MAETETNRLTMRLLALASHCEGPKATEIRGLIAKLPIAAYNERFATDSEIKALKKENEGLKQRLAQEVLVNRMRGPPSTPAEPASHGRAATEEDTQSSSRFDLQPSPVKQSQHRTASSLTTRDPRLTPPLQQPRELFPEGASNRPVKRLRVESSPPPDPTRPRRPECVGCYTIKGVCDGRTVCSVCKARKYGCEYRECWEGLRCRDRHCTRLHPDQWDPKTEEPPRKVKQWRGRPGMPSRWE